VASDLSGVSGIAARYAAALYELADEATALDATAADLAALRSMIAGNADLARFLRSPLVGREAQTKGMLAVLDAAKVSDLVRRFVGVVGAHRRLFALAPMIEAFLATLARRRGEASAEVTSARPLSEGESQRLAEALKTAVGKKVTIAAKVDPGLIGGLVVRVGSRMVDNSVRTQLNKLQRALKAAG
jgi:F-type H+-transporting ATPase subunit delta